MVTLTNTHVQTRHTHTHATRTHHCVFVSQHPCVAPLNFDSDVGAVCASGVPHCPERAGL